MRPTLPSLRQRRQCLALVWLTAPSRIVVPLAFVGMAVVALAGFVVLDAGSEADLGPAILLVDLLVGLHLVGLVHSLTAKAAAAIPGCPLAGERLIRTRRLCIRPPRPGDADALSATIDDEFRRENGWDEKTTAVWDRTLRAPLDLAEDLGTLLVERHDGEVIGGCTAAWAPADAARLLGWWIRAEDRRLGYATEVVTALVPRLLDDGTARIGIGMRTTNAACHRIVERLGADQLGTWDHTLPNGERVPSDWFEVLALAATDGEPRPAT